MSGALKSKPNPLQASSLERMRLHMRVQATASWRPLPDEGWQAKVEELANRAFSVEKLLDFCEELKTHMPHFDPMHHTTNDVVREVIIPRSAHCGSAFAVIMMAGVPTRPHRMVTHNR